ncbi:hypothetical protein [Agromyces sp. GXS1127]|uniref:hypothetical protein n=1 Tax=Agromyces sp. GXS1127 TaxID=3424181 RepID=UPI003D31B890
MDWLDEFVRDAAPPALGSSPGTDVLAAAVAAAAVESGRPGSGHAGLRRLAGGIGVGLGVLAVGVGAAAATPAVIDWLGWSPDVVAQRTFDLGDGQSLGLCEVFIRVTPEYGGAVSNEEADRRTEAARGFLTEHDWDPLIASITADQIRSEYEADQARRDASTTDTATPPPATLSGAATHLIADRISAEFALAGHLQDGVAIEAAAGPCIDDDGAPE